MSRIVLASVGALAVVSLSACASDGGTDASPQTTIKLTEPDYVTAVPILTSTVPTTVAGAVAGDTTVTVPGEQIYVILDGDILVRIAKKYGITAQQIVDYNQWTDGFAHVIYPGLKIKIPPGATTAAAGGDTSTGATPEQTTTTVDVASGGVYVIVDGDTLSRIANKNGTTVAAIVAVNGWADDSHLIYKGLKIKLPAKSG